MPVRKRVAIYDIYGRKDALVRKVTRNYGKGLTLIERIELQCKRLAH